VRRLQQSQGRYYWSGTSETLFRREGLISIRTVSTPTEQCTLLIVARDATCLNNIVGIPRVFEGPLSNNQLVEHGLTSTIIQTELIQVDDDSSLSIHCPEILVRNPDASRVPLELQGEDVKWNHKSFEVQFLWGEGWDPVLNATDPVSGKSGAIVVRRGKDLVIGFGVFDLLTRWFAVPPLNARYGGFSRIMSHELVSKRFLSLVVNHATDSGAPHPIKIDRWPIGYSAALTIRHDYDRKADFDQLSELIKNYERLSIRAVIGFLPYFMEKETIDLFRLAGHEIQGHVASPSEADLREDLKLLKCESAEFIKGVTIHGGPNGIGFRGQTHFDWFDDSDLSYCECFGIRDTIPVPVNRLHDDIPSVSRMIATPGHYSLDGSTAPEDHRLDALLLSVPKSLADGNYTILMNHPDIHHQQMIDLINKISLKNVWRATSAEVVRWHRISRYESHVRYENGYYKVSFPEPLFVGAILNIGGQSFEVDVGKHDHQIPIIGS